MDNTGKKFHKTRDCAMDLMRVVMMLFIFNFHFFAGIGREDSFFYGYANGGWGSVGCTMFFMLSGYFLYMNYQDMNIDRDSLNSFYKKHLASLYIPFYLSFIIGFIYLAIRAKSLSFKGPLYLLGYSLFGVDNYASFIGLDSYYLNIGEWYSTIIILLYLLCPFIIFLKRTYKIAPLLIFFMLYIVNIWTKPFGISPDAGIFTGVLMFYLGMYICENRELLKKPGALHISCLITGIVILTTELPTINGSSLFWKNLLGIFIFLILFMVFHVLIKEGRNIKIISFLGKITYCVYLLHHFVFYEFFQGIAMYADTNIQLFGVYIIYILSTMLAAIAVHFVSNKITGMILVKRKIK